MAHVNIKVITDMISKKSYGLNRDDNVQKQDCSVCVYSKQTKAASKGKLINNAQDITLHLDISDPLDDATYGGKNYFHTMTTTSQSYTIAEPLNNMNEAVNFVLNHIAWSERNSASKVKRLHSDNAKKFTAMKKTLKNNRTTLTASSPNSLQFYGLSERMNRTLLENIRSLIKKYGIDRRYRGEALTYRALLHNSTTKMALKRRAPHETLMSKLPDIYYIRKLGCVVYLHKHKEGRTLKLVDQAQLGIYLAS